MRYGNLIETINYIHVNYINKKRNKYIQNQYLKCFKSAQIKYK